MIATGWVHPTILRGAAGGRALDCAATATSPFLPAATDVVTLAGGRDSFWNASLGIGLKSAAFLAVPAALGLFGGALGVGAAVVLYAVGSVIAERRHASQMRDQMKRDPMYQQYADGVKPRTVGAAIGGGAMGLLAGASGAAGGVTGALVCVGLGVAIAVIGSKIKD